MKISPYKKKYINRDFKPFKKLVPNYNKNHNYIDNGPFWFKYFSVSRFFNICLSVLDWQGDGDILITFAILYRAFQLVIPFKGFRFKFRCDWKLFGKCYTWWKGYVNV